MVHQSALRDLIAGSKRWRDWLSLGWYDFVLMRRRAVLGPLWEMLYVAVWTAGLSVVFMNREAGPGINYISYVASGVTLFGFIANTVNSSANLFQQRATQLLNFPTPWTLHVYRLVTTNVIRLLFQLPVVLVTVLVFVGRVHVPALWAILGLVTYLVAAMWITLLVATLGVRYGDMRFLMATAMRFLFFMSPVFWVPVDGTLREMLATYNPLTYFFDLVRSPLLGEAPSILSWVVVASICLIGIALTYGIFVRMYKKIPFWL